MSAGALVMLGLGSVTAVGATGYGSVMRNNTKKKLKLSSDTIATLSPGSLKLVAGGGSDACTTEGNKSLCLHGCQTGDPCAA